MTNFGYARVSTATQDEVAQVDALRRAGVADDQLFIDHASGTRTDRPELPPGPDEGPTLPLDQEKGGTLANP